MVLKMRRLCTATSHGYLLCQSVLSNLSLVALTKAQTQQPLSKIEAAPASNVDPSGMTALLGFRSCLVFFVYILLFFAFAFMSTFAFVGYGVLFYKLALSLSKHTQAEAASAGGTHHLCDPNLVRPAHRPVLLLQWPLAFLSTLIFALTIPVQQFHSCASAVCRQSF